MRKYKIGVDRQQSHLFPMNLDDFVEKNNPVRAIDVYVESLNISRLGFGAKEPAHRSGQPGYSPASLLKLYIYGYINRIRSGRALEKACR